jgi:hypothetical protein
MVPRCLWLLWCTCACGGDGAHLPLLALVHMRGQYVQSWQALNRVLFSTKRLKEHLRCSTLLRKCQGHIQFFCLLVAMLMGNKAWY